MELSKKDKKVAREIIELGLQKELAKGLAEADSILKDWKSKSLNNHESYLALYKHINELNDRIADRYDRITGSKYLCIIAAQLYEGYISENDLSEFSGEAIKSVMLIKEFFD